MNFAKHLKLFAMSGALLASATFAHATPITAGIYQTPVGGITIQGTPSTLTGTVTFNSSGIVTAANLTFNNAALGNPVYSVIGATGTCCNPVNDFSFVTVSGNKGQLELLYSPNLNALGDIVLCVVGSGCNQASYLQYYSPNFGPASFTGSGLLLPGASATPEPASLLLLGTGLLGAAGVGRRKILAAFRG